MMEIVLNKLRFYAYHGLYAEDTQIGSEYEVNVRVSYQPESMITSLDQTVDYTRIYDIVKKKMATPVPLLETLAMQIADEIAADSSVISRVFVHIEKLNPPVNNFQGSMGVEFTKTIIR